MLASRPALAGAGRMARMGLAAASKEGLGLGLLFTSCPLCVAAGVSILKEKSYNWKKKSPLSLSFLFFPELCFVSKNIIAIAVERRNRAKDTAVL